MKILIRNLYGFFVSERALFTCESIALRRMLLGVIERLLDGVADKNLRLKWANLKFKVQC